MSKWFGWKFLEGNIQLAISEMETSFPKIFGHYISSTLAFRSFYSIFLLRMQATKSDCCFTLSMIQCCVFQCITQNGLRMVEIYVPRNLIHVHMIHSVNALFCLVTWRASVRLQKCVAKIYKQHSTAQLNVFA